MILTKSYSGTDLWIDAKRIMSVSQKEGEMCLVTMECGGSSEEWFINESIKTLLPKIEAVKEEL